MKRIKRSYCSYCSTEKEDERDLEESNKIITCINCGAQQIWVPENEFSPYHYLEEAEEKGWRKSTKKN